MNPPTATPRTNAAWAKTFESELNQFWSGNAANQMRDECEKLELELTETERLRFGADADRRRLRAEVERWKTVAAEMSQQREHNANEASRLRAERAELKLEKMATALADCISTFRSDDKTTIITAERQEAWRAALLSYKPDHTFT
jgi:hypothetical protein